MNGSAERKNNINWNFIVEYNNNTVSSLEVHIFTSLQTADRRSVKNELNAKARTFAFHKNTEITINI